jgi:hypothetical protein
VLTTESVEARPFREVPHTDTLFLRVGKDKLLFRMEQDARNIVVMATASIYSPCLLTIRRTKSYFQEINKSFLLCSRHLRFTHSPICLKCAFWENRKSNFNPQENTSVDDLKGIVIFLNIYCCIKISYVKYFVTPVNIPSNVKKILLYFEGLYPVSWCF